MKKVVLPLAATLALVSSSMFSLPKSADATSSNTEEEWVTVEESSQSSASILETAVGDKNAGILAKDYTSTWNLKKIRSGDGSWKCKYSMLTKAKAKMKINKIEAKSRLYSQKGGLTKSATDANSNSNYAGAEALGGVTGGWGCKGSAYGNTKYERNGYKTVNHQKKYDIFDIL
ncbi:hypothetical protein [Bacillus pumilus]|uniref:hypothetical protein n=1 Tax=Bacillus pumilus TaxID=1408 RepID=UPI0016423BFF|nr:hypothetical protein [Bacillus pumilus]